MSLQTQILKIAAREVELHDGKVAIVDKEDFNWARCFKWKSYSNGNNWYAKAYVPAIQQDSSMHRIIAGAERGQLVDHRNGNGLDNRKENLRIATHSQNMMNRPAHGASSKFKGVSWDKQSRCWTARIRRDGHQLYLGRFGLEEDAAAAYNAAALEIQGEFAWQNVANTPPEAPKRGRKPEPWYYTERDAWYVSLEGKRYRLARGKDSREEAWANFGKLVEVSHQTPR